MNQNLSEHKEESLRVLKKALTVFLDFEKACASEFTQKIEPLYPQITELKIYPEQNLKITSDGVFLLNIHKFNFRIHQNHSQFFNSQAS